MARTRFPGNVYFGRRPSVAVNRTGLVVTVVAIGLLLGLAGASLAGLGPLGEEASDGPSPSDGGDEPAANASDECTPSSDTDTSGTANPHPAYDSTTVTVRSAGGAVLGCVEAAIADNGSLRYTGLSDTADLPEHRGMLFVYEESQDLTYVMREMDFPIDIVFVASNGTITSIHHARAPGPDEDGNTIQFEGHGQYVLEVNRDWTTERDVAVGDTVEFDV